MEIADILTRRVKDPRVGFVTVTAVDLTPDLKHAWVYVTMLREGAQEADSMAALARAGGFIRGELGRRLKLRYVPDLTFVKDTSVERVARVLNLLNGLHPDQAASRNEGTEGDTRREA
jgi:ribosome-binding factor A